MAKNYHLNRKPYDYSLFTQGVDDSGKAIQEAYTPATDQQISKFEADYECSLPTDYKQFLLNCNGGKITRKNDTIQMAVDVIHTVNEKSLVRATVIDIDHFYSLDEATLLARGERENNLWSIMETWYLPKAQDAYREFVNMQDIVGLVGKKFIVIAAGSASKHVILLSCDDEFNGKVLVVDTNLYPDKPFDYLAILADSFDEFQQALYYEG